MSVPQTQVSDLRKTTRADDGTASIPSISFSSDLDTGLYRPTTNTLAITTNATERVRVTSTGSVGIGTTDPQALHHVHGQSFLKDGLQHTLYYNVTGTYTANTWNTLFNGSVIPTGVYILRAYAHTFLSGGGSYEETYSGMFSWFDGATNSAVTDSIPTHRAGHAPNTETISFRTARFFNNTGNGLCFQFTSNFNWSSLDGVNSGRIFRVWIIRLA